jgi:hypothetical protein
MECTDPENCCIRKSDQDNKNKCEKPFEWDYDYFEPKITGPVITNVRCLRYNGLPKCTIYFGKAPAQTEVNKINLMNTTSTSTELEVIVKNSGANELAFGKATLKLYKKSVNEWIETDYTQEPQEVTTLMPQESSHLYWSLTPKNPGKYKAEFTFEALNAGHDKKAIEFDKSVSVTCQINESKTDTLIGENGKFNELHYCNNCEYSYDCANAWKAKIPSKTFYPMTKEQTYCIKDTETGAC